MNEQRLSDIARDVCHFRDRDGFDVAVRLGLQAAWAEAEREAYEAAAQICEHRASWNVSSTRIANAERKALLDAAENIRIAGTAALQAGVRT